jgi:hypothetical protein
MDPRFPQSGSDRLIDRALKAAAMDRKLRHLVTGIQASRLAPDLLAEPIGVEQLEGADGDGIEALEQTEFGQFLDGVRQRVDADAKLADDVGLLVELSVDPAGL